MERRRRSKRCVSVPELGKMTIRDNRTVQEHKRRTLYNLPVSLFLKSFSPFPQLFSF
jgi:hypothetical protein